VSEELRQAGRQAGDDAPDPGGHAADAGPSGRDPASGRPGWLGVYLGAFALVVASTAVMAFGGLSLLRSGSTIEGSTTLFWVSIVLSVGAIVLAALSIVLAGRRR
jgi:hypothetical protein